MNEDKRAVENFWTWDVLVRIVLVLAALAWVSWTWRERSPEQIVAEESLTTQEKIQLVAAIKEKMVELTHAPDRSFVVGEKDGEEISLLCFRCGESDIRHVMLCQNLEDCQGYYYAPREAGFAPGAWRWLADVVIHEPGSASYPAVAAKFAQQ